MNNEASKIEIGNIDRKTVNKKDGTTTQVVEVTDSRSGRLCNTWDTAWAANWKIGDIIDVKFGESKSWTDRRNVTHENWPITNPTAVKKPFTPRAAESSVASPWLIAATLLAPHFVGKKIDLTVVKEFADKVAAAMAPVVAAPAPTAPVAPVAPVAPAAVVTPAQPAPAAPVAPVVPQTPVVTHAPVLADQEFTEDSDKPF